MAVLGIDLGTTNSVVATVTAGDVAIIPDRQGRRLHPSVVALLPDGGKSFSHEAVARRIHARAREALKLPDKKYPKPELIGLIGCTLAAHPGLATEAERPTVYRHARAAA